MFEHPHRVCSSIPTGALSLSLWPFKNILTSKLSCWLFGNPPTFITRFSNRCTALLRFLPASANLSKYAGHKPFYGAKPAFVQGHILSTGGDALAILCWKVCVRLQLGTGSWVDGCCLPMCQLPIALSWVFSHLMTSGLSTLYIMPSQQHLPLCVITLAWGFFILWNGPAQGEPAGERTGHKGPTQLLQNVVSICLQQCFFWSKNSLFST
jgi:hypothetical protein